MAWAACSFTARLSVEFFSAFLSPRRSSVGLNRAILIDGVHEMLSKITTTCQQAERRAASTDEKGMEVRKREK